MARYSSFNHYRRRGNSVRRGNRIRKIFKAIRGRRR